MDEKEIGDALAEMAKRFGFKSAVFMGTESSTPCEAHIKTGKCDGRGHETIVAATGIRREYLEGFILGAIKGTNV